ncbi:MAG: protein kinase [Thermoanaerobaculia bacterium]|nr:protein kinase [Thermoanaerobaculia bacterium]
MQLGPYRLISRLGAGGMGEVWRAEDTRLQRPAAIKILSEKIASDPDWKARFLREARTAAQLNHPNIATIYSIDEEGDVTYIAMELVEGPTLAGMIASQSLSVNDVTRIGRQTADALAAAHDKQIVHRDIKPDNIVVLQRSIKVLDFGIAKVIGPTADDSLTRGQLILGTPYYMSPEQALGNKMDFRTDIFSLGVVMYEALAGRRPFQGTSVTDTVLQILTKEAPDLQTLAPHLPSDLVAIVNRCMAKQPENRYDAHDLAEALEIISAPVRRLTREQLVPTLALERQSAPTPVRTPLDATTSAAPEPSAPKTGMEWPAMPSGAPAPAPTWPPRVPTSARPQPAREPATPPPPVRPPPPQLPSRPALDPGALKAISRVLITDDDAVTREMLASILRQNNVPFDEAANGAEAIKLLKQQQYGLLLLDLLMPRIDGWGVLDFLRSKVRNGKTKVYILTGYKEQRLSTADQEIVAGMIYKPVREEEIDRILQKTAKALA